VPSGYIYMIRTGGVTVSTNFYWGGRSAWAARGRFRRGALAAGSCAHMGRPGTAVVLTVAELSLVHGEGTRRRVSLFNSNNNTLVVLLS